MTEKTWWREWRVRWGDGTVGPSFQSPGLAKKYARKFDAPYVLESRVARIECSEWITWQTVKKRG